MSDFDLKKFLVENKLTRSSRESLNEMDGTGMEGEFTIEFTSKGNVIESMTDVVGEGGYYSFEDMMNDFVSNLIGLDFEWNDGWEGYYDWAYGENSNVTANFDEYVRTEVLGNPDVSRGIPFEIPSGLGNIMIYHNGEQVTDLTPYL